MPGLPAVAAHEGLTLAYMRKYGAFEITHDNYVPYEGFAQRAPVDERPAARGRRFRLCPGCAGTAFAPMAKWWAWPSTARRRWDWHAQPQLEFFSQTLYAWAGRRENIPSPGR